MRPPHSTDQTVQGGRTAAWAGVGAELLLMLMLTCGGEAVTVLVGAGDAVVGAALGVTVCVTTAGAAAGALAVPHVFMVSP
jgi:hypothetical protein